MDTELKQAIEKSDYMRTFQNQKRLIKEKYKKECILYYNGGMFILTQQFVFCLQESITDIIIDANDIPVKIENNEDFLETVLHTYKEATERYYDAYLELCKFRDAKGLLT